MELELPRLRRFMGKVKKLSVIFMIKYCVVLVFSFLTLGCYKAHEQQYCNSLYIYFPPSRDIEERNTALHVFIDLKKLSECERFKEKSIFVEKNGRKMKIFFGKNIENLEDEVDELSGPFERESYGPSYYPSRPIGKEKKAIHLYNNDSFSFYTDTEGNLLSVNFWTSGAHSVKSLNIFGKNINFPTKKEMIKDQLGVPDEVFKFITQ